MNNCEVPKRVLLATVRSSHSRGRCRRMLVKQTLADPQHYHGTPVRAVCASDLEETDDTEENDSRFYNHTQCVFISH